MTPQNAGVSRSRSSERSTRMVMALLMVVAVGVLSFLPIESKMALHTKGRWHTWGHVAVFAVIGYLANRAVQSTGMRVLVFAGVVLLGFGIEFAEHHVFYFSLEWRDVMADAAGALIGTAVGMLSVRGEG